MVVKHYKRSNKNTSLENILSDKADSITTIRRSVEKVELSDSLRVKNSTTKACQSLQYHEKKAKEKEDIMKCF